jgi:hypothetical protein
MKVNKFRIFCVTDNKYEYVWLEDGEAAPSFCPVNSSHTIDANSISIVQSVSEDVYSVENSIGKGGPQVNLRGMYFTATAGEDTVYNYDIAEKLFLRGAKLLIDGCSFFDSLSLELVDHQNLLGYGAGFVLSKYASNYPVHQGMELFDNERLTELDLNGFRFKLTYKSLGSVDVKVALGLRGYK